MDLELMVRKPPSRATVVYPIWHFLDICSNRCCCGQPPSQLYIFCTGTGRQGFALAFMDPNRGTCSGFCLYVPLYNCVSGAPYFNFQPHLCLDLLVLKATHANLALNQSSELAFACRMWSKMKMRCQAFALGGRPKQEPVEPLRQEPVEADRAGIGLQSTAQTRSSRFQSTEDCRGRDPFSFPFFFSGSPTITSVRVVLFFTWLF